MTPTVYPAFGTSTRYFLLFSPSSAHIYFPLFHPLLLLFHTFGAHFFSCLPACTVLRQCFHCSIIILLITQKKFCFKQKKNSFFVMSQLQQQQNLDAVITINKSDDCFLLFKMQMFLVLLKKTEGDLQVKCSSSAWQCFFEEWPSSTIGKFHLPPLLCVIL